jgi:hypothetical protein
MPSWPSCDLLDVRTLLYATAINVRSAPTTVAVVELLTPSEQGPRQQTMCGEG